MAWWLEQGAVWLAAVGVALAVGSAFYTSVIYAGYWAVRGGGFGGMAPDAEARPIRAMVVELFSCFIILALGIPALLFRRLRLAAGTGGGIPVLCIHGYTQNWGNFVTMAPTLARAGCGPVYAVNIAGKFRSIEDGARQAAEHVAEIRALTGAPQVDVVCHSMGGLIIRAAMARHGAAPSVRRVVTLGSPHAGTLIASLGPGRNAREMQRHSRFVEALPPAPPNLTSVWSTTDGIVLPPESARCSENVVFHDLGHLSLLLSPRVHSEVARTLTATRTTHEGTALPADTSSARA